MPPLFPVRHDPPGYALTIGYTVLDVIVYGKSYGHAAGGTAVNIAADLAHLGWASSVAASCGYDPAGSVLRSDLAQSGASSDQILVKEGMVTPRVIHEVLGNGKHRWRFKCPRCGRKMPQFRPISRSYAAEVAERCQPDVLIADRVSRAAVLLARAVSERGGLVVFEPSLLGGGPRLAEMVELADLVKFSVERVGDGDLPDPPANTNQVRVRTLGDEGAEWCRNGGRWQKVEGFSVESVDSAGAGDWTTAALIAALGPITSEEMGERNLDDPLRTAQAVATLNCEHVGARGLNRVAGQKQIVEEAQRILNGGQRGAVECKPPMRVDAAGIDCSLCLSQP